MLITVDCASCRDRPYTWSTGILRGSGAAKAVPACMFCAEHPSVEGRPLRCKFAISLWKRVCTCTHDHFPQVDKGLALGGVEQTLQCVPYGTAMH
jgi:hypothetical protein